MAKTEEKVQQDELSSFVVKSAVKEYVQSEHDGIRISGEFMGALSAAIQQTLDKAAARAKANNRSTLREWDLDGYKPD